MLYWSRRREKSLGRNRDDSASTKWYRFLHGWRVRWVLVSGLVGLGLLFTQPIMGQPAVVELLQTLNLSDYRPDMRLPPLTGQTVTGEEVSLAALHGRVVLVNFWASWCAECRPEMPVFERLHRDFAAQGLMVLGINFREDIPHIQGYAKELNLTFPLVLDPGGEIFRSYGVIGLPTTFLVGRNGRPVALAIGARAWGSAEARALIQALLAESVVP
jgi:peroxiredoxin